MEFQFDHLKAIPLKGISKQSFEQAGSILKSAGKILLLTHMNPDGDAVGSILGLYWYLVKQGHRTMMIIPNEIPFFLDWMPGREKILLFEDDQERSVQEIKNADVIVCLDFNEADRLGDLREAFLDSTAYKILIDHHPRPEKCADFVLSDILYSSTAEMVYDLIVKTSGAQWIDKSIAECLFAGIMTDTGCFSFASSSPETYLVVADLLTKDIDKDLIYERVYENFSADRMRLLGFSLNENMVFIPSCDAAYIFLRKEDLVRFNHVTGDTEGFVNLPFSIKGIKITALFIEKEDYIKISFRSKGEIKINRFSEVYFNGGGHKNAAGGESYLNLEETIKKFEKLLPAFLNKTTSK